MARPRQITDEDILKMTRACALERGPQVSLEVVAERLGVTPPALIKRFGSRRALLLAALRPNDDPQWIRDIANGPDERPLVAQMEEKLGRILDLMVREVPCLVALRESGIPIEEIFVPGTIPAPVRGLRALAAWLERAAERGLAACDDSETAASAIMGALQSRIFLAHLLNRSFLHRNQNEYVKSVSTMFARALAPSQHAVVAPAPARRAARRHAGGR